MLTWANILMAKRTTRKTKDLKFVCITISVYFLGLFSKYNVVSGKRPKY